MPLQAPRPVVPVRPPAGGAHAPPMTERQSADRAGSERGSSGSGKASDRAQTRHETRSGSGSNEPKHNERKEQGDWVSRQGGDQTRGSDGRRTDDKVGDEPNREDER